jgi:hypothetical protein
MPFTISHAAAALPLRSLTRLPLAALMAGSMSPDFAFFVPDVRRFETHNLPALFWFCLPAGLAAWLFFVSVLERPTIACLPEAWRLRITPSDALAPRSIFMAALGVLLGAVSHLVWDAFTHDYTPVANALPSLGYRAFFVLQVLSSVFGLVVLAAWALRIRGRPLLPATQVVPEVLPRIANFERYLALLVIAASSGLMGLLNLTRFGPLRVGSFMFVLLVGAMAGAALGWTLVAIVIRLRTRYFTQPGCN